MMKRNIYNETKKRSKLRLYLGKQYYTFKRYIKWYFGNEKYSKDILNYQLPYLIFTHNTPLIRKLQGVDPVLQYNKVTNLKIATSRVNGICIKPGEVFSYWKLIGKPTKRKGYKDGLILNPNGTFGAGTGGGLCQLSNLIYWMTLHTPLTVIERYRHSHDIFPDSNRTQPFGSGATCVYNYLDLQIYNGTDKEFQLIVYLTEDSLVGEWRSVEPSQYNYEVYEKEHFISSTYWGGYIRNNKIYRRVYENGILIDDEYITENHAIMMYQPLLPSK
ncbi:VanW family protein [Acetivibrio clariflavus]|uniref:VanW family protein n=1 Tax=Acetivibrio clariflavus TaxID=288965 RepID=UPI0031F54E1A